MPTIVFACKSNSCRSQMAEGWAHDWINKKKDDVDSKLKTLRNGKVDEFDEDAMKNHLSLLKNTIIASVALDSSAVFETQEEQRSQISVSASLPKTNTKKRKNIKSKAIEAMAKDGVNIGSYIPKTLNEILPLLRSGDTNYSVQHGDNNDTADVDTTNISKSFRSSSDSSAIQDIGNKIQYEAIKDKQEKDSKPVDKLIVLCSCGDELKYKIVRQSKSVEEWTIDPPTTAAKNGEGDAAYRRVSLELKNEVDILMESLIGDTSAFN